MGSRGPKRKPIEATRPKPSILAGWDAPSHLEGVEVEAWNHLVSLLTRSGNLGRTDPTLVECYAVQVGILRASHAAIKRDGVTVTNGMKATASHPALQSINSATMRIKTICSDLGLSPATSQHGASTVATVQEHSGSKWDGILGVTG